MTRTPKRPLPGPGALLVLQACAGLSQAEYAAEAGVTKAAMGQYLAGRRRPNRETRARLAAVALIGYDLT